MTEGAEMSDYQRAQLGALLAELQEGAALEAAVYMTQGGRGQRNRSGRAFRPARRLLRTLARLGPGEAGQRCLLSALQAVEAQVIGGAGGTGTDVSSAAFWWSNVVVLRHHLNVADGGAWQAPLDRAEDIEVATFKHVLSTLWDGIIVPAVAVQPLADAAQRLGPHSRCSSISGTSAFGLSAGPEADGRGAGGPGARGRGAAPGSGEDEAVAVQRWLDLLDRTHEALAGARCNEVAALLEQQVVKQMLCRIDRLVFSSVLRSASAAHLNQQQQQRNGGRGDPGAAGRGPSGYSTPDSEDADTPMLSAPFFPVRPGMVSFGTGMHLKMAATRLSQWAVEADYTPDGTDPATLFPLMTSCAAILMLPKEQLADPGSRNKVCPAISMSDLVSLLRRFEPDDFDATTMPPELLGTLENQVHLETRGQTRAGQLRRAESPPGSGRSGRTDSTTSLRGGGGITALGDDDYGDLLAAGSRAAHGLAAGCDYMEVDDDSDEELSALEGLIDAPADRHRSGGLARFDLLRQLWYGDH